MKVLGNSIAGIAARGWPTCVLHTPERVAFESAKIIFEKLRESQFFPEMHKELAFQSSPLNVPVRLKGAARRLQQLRDGGQASILIIVMERQLVTELPRQFLKNNWRAELPSVPEIDHGEAWHINCQEGRCRVIRSSPAQQPQPVARAS